MMVGITNVSRPERQEMQTRFIPDTDWRMIGDSGEPAFENSWANYGGAYAEAGFRRDAEGWVYAQGLVKSGTKHATVFTLPEGYRPGRETFVTSLGHNYFPNYIRITTAGEIKINWVTGGSNSWNSLSGLRFNVSDAGRYNQQSGHRAALDVRLHTTSTYERPNFQERRTGMNTIQGIALGKWTYGTGAYTTLGRLHPPRSYFFAAQQNTSTFTFPQVGPKMGVYQASAPTNHCMWSHEWGSARIEDEWIVPTLSNSWVAGTPDTHNDTSQVGYWKDQHGFVHLRGWLKSGSSATAVMFTLPSGFRPAGQIIFPANGNGGNCRVDVKTNGEVYAAQGGSTSGTSISNICFYADGS